MPLDPAKVEWLERDGAVELAVKVVPGASRTRLSGHLGPALKVAVAAPPEAGKANAELVAFLAARLGLRRSEVVIVSGQSQARKRVRLQGLDAAEAQRRLGAASVDPGR